MDLVAFEHHLTSPQGQDRIPEEASVATVGGYECCDQIRMGIRLNGDHVEEAGFEASGCGAATAAGSAAVTLARGRHIFDAARIGAEEIARELGGLSSAKRHAAELATDALARSLGAAVRESRMPKSTAADRTLVAMSGGVDSAVAALQCAGSGETVAVTLELWSDAENDAQRSCCSASAVSRARGLAHSMGLPHFTLDLRAEFRDGVVEPFISGYASGETPNPCVGCNGHVRLDAMLALADQLGCRWLATGHYARKAETDSEGAPLLRMAADPAKDQSYMLAALSSASLDRMRFPLGDLTKPEVRRMAAAARLPVANQADSQDLCFLAGTDRGRFLARHGGLSDQPGDVVDRRGTVLARHRGQHHFTVGQRKGIGVSGPEPLYVLDKDAVHRRVVVGPRQALQTRTVTLRGVRLHRSSERVERVKLRYRSKSLRARVPRALSPGQHARVTLELDEPALGPAPGQLACLLEGDVIIGWGTITRA